ncbi:MAG: hypothetical protein V3S92_06105, partial [Alphaproteobacteria bacterium]
TFAANRGSIVEGKNDERASQCLMGLDDQSVWGVNRQGHALGAHKFTRLREIARHQPDGHRYGLCRHVSISLLVLDQRLTCRV